ncbi:NAD(P)-binding protein [Acephala macrosclerotiorum]|nr:NAD(P)-binding protein [Acephala macrosclerotiorum]
MALQVNGKVALVTGGGSGICLEFTKLLLSKGCTVLVADLNLTPDAEKLISSHETKDENDGAEKKPRTVFKKTDVTNWVQLQDAFDECIRLFGSLDIVCPGAGVFEPRHSTPRNRASRPKEQRTNNMKILVSCPSQEIAAVIVAECLLSW